MITTPVDLVVLDMAGTTIDDGQQVYKVLGETAIANGVPAAQIDINRWHGAAKHEALREMLTATAGTPPSDDVLEAVVGDFRSRLSAAYAAQPPTVLPGVADALAQLRSAGVKIALTTGFDRDIVNVLLPPLGWDGDAVADTIVCGSDVAAGRPAPYMIYRSMEHVGITDISRVLVAGDTPRDLESGTNAGAGHIVGVLSGASDTAELGSYRHTHLLPSVAELPALLDICSEVHTS